MTFPRTVIVRACGLVFGREVWFKRSSFEMAAPQNASRLGQIAAVAFFAREACATSASVLFSRRDNRPALQSENCYVIPIGYPFLEI
jgi:hypothetical protein